LLSISIYPFHQSLNNHNLSWWWIQLSLPLKEEMEEKLLTLSRRSSCKSISLAFLNDHTPTQLTKLLLRLILLGLPIAFLRTLWIIPTTKVLSRINNHKCRYQWITSISNSQMPTITFSPLIHSIKLISQQLRATEAFWLQASILCWKNEKIVFYVSIYLVSFFYVLWHQFNNSKLIIY